MIKLTFKELYLSSDYDDAVQDYVQTGRDDNSFYKTLNLFQDANVIQYLLDGTVREFLTHEFANIETLFDSLPKLVTYIGKHIYFNIYDILTIDFAIAHGFDINKPEWQQNILLNGYNTSTDNEQSTYNTDNMQTQSDETKSSTQLQVGTIPPATPDAISNATTTNNDKKLESTTIDKNHGETKHTLELNLSMFTKSTYKIIYDIIDSCAWECAI